MRCPKLGSGPRFSTDHEADVEGSTKASSCSVRDCKISSRSPVKRRVTSSVAVSVRRVSNPGPVAILMERNEPISRSASSTMKPGWGPRYRRGMDRRHGHRHLCMGSRDALIVIPMRRGACFITESGSGGGEVAAEKRSLPWLKFSPGRAQRCPSATMKSPRTSPRATQGSPRAGSWLYPPRDESG